MLAEIAIAATDLQEVLGMAIGIQLLTAYHYWRCIHHGTGYLPVIIPSKKLGMRKMEAFIIALIAIVGICFLVNIILAAHN